jgi:hypothetical protein
VSIGLSDDQRVLAQTLNQWATEVGCPALVKDSETAGVEAFAPLWKQVVDLGVTSIAIPEEFGGAGGSLVDLAVAIEACAAAMVPGPVVPTVLAAQLLAANGGPSDLIAAIVEGEITVGVALDGADLTVADGCVSGTAAPVWGLGCASHALVGSGTAWHLIDLADAGATAVVAAPVDFSSRIGTLTLDGVEATVTITADPQRVRDLLPPSRRPRLPASPAMR